VAQRCRDSKKTVKGDDMKDAIELLISDHEKVRGLLEELSQTTDRAEKKRQDLLQKIEMELHVHTTIEEEIFYPAFRDAGTKEDKKMFFEAVEEHRAVEALVVPDLKKTSPSETAFAGRVKVLKELVEHHVQEEEQSMFPRARELFGKQQLQELGERMENRKKELMREQRKAA
jgi:hemerythrin-like domain-containing protein